MPSVSGGVCVSLSSCCCARAAEFLPCHYCLQSPLSRVILAPLPLSHLSTQLVATAQRVQDCCNVACMLIVGSIAGHVFPSSTRLALCTSHLAPRACRLSPLAEPCRAAPGHAAPRRAAYRAAPRTPPNTATPPRAVPLQGRRRTPPSRMEQRAAPCPERRRGCTA